MGIRTPVLKAHALDLEVWKWGLQALGFSFRVSGLNGFGFGI